MLACLQGSQYSTCAGSIADATLDDTPLKFLCFFAVIEL